MKYTVLEMTQEILSSMDADEINSINDTTEALQVARIIRQSYLDLVEDTKPASHFVPFELNASVDISKPVLMTVPAGINKVLWIKYNIQAVGATAPDYVYMDYLDRETFLERMSHLNLDDTYVDSLEFPSTNSSNITLLFRNDGPPQFYTDLDNNTIMFDSYDSDVDTTLQKSKTICYGRRNVDLILSDDTVPDLDDSMFPRLLNEAKELCFAELKSVSHAVANRNARRGRSRSTRDKFRSTTLSDFDQLPNFGRK